MGPKTLGQNKIKIEGRTIYLKKLSAKNATKEYCNWLCDSEVNQYLETREATIDELKKYIKEKNKNPNCLFLGIFLKKNRRHIGNIKLEPINFKDRKATVGILVGDKNYWGRGIGTEAVKLLINYALQKLNLNEINLGVISENKAAVNLYKKVGFKVDRIEKDRVVMSIKELPY